MPQANPEQSSIFYDYGYQIVRELGHNRAGGRVTYLATEVNSQRSVVLKQFQFACTDSCWSDYQLYEQEIEVLRGLDHANIPRYLDSFQTAAGFCMVQEYKDAPSLATKRSWQPQQIKQIALSVLEILNYLQHQIPPVIHRDLKPENILIDDRMIVNLVDFGFARLGGGEVAASSVVKGTLGFMPPEQLFNRQLTVASDLYSLGATLICLLTNTSSTEVGSLMDELGRIQFEHRVTQLHPDFIAWLQKLVEPNYQNRYATAEAALQALVPLNVMRPVQQKPWQWAVGGALVTGLAIAASLPIFFKAAETDLLESNDNTINAQTIVTIDPAISEDLNTLSMQQERVYFSVKLPNLNQGNHKAMCQLFDGTETLVAMGESTLKLNADGGEAWCLYNFGKDTDQPGTWTFKFFLNDRPIVQRQLSVR